MTPKYFFGVTSTKINGNSVRFNKTLLFIDNKGYGGTTISTTTPYTVLESSIYNSFLAAFVKAMPKKVKRVPNVAPFGAISVAPVLVLMCLTLTLCCKTCKSVSWRMFGANSMVKAKKGVWCLGFVKLPVEYPPRYIPRYPIIIGGH